MKWNIKISCLILMVLSGFSVIRAEVVANESGKCGYMDENGNLIVDYKYDFIGPFSEYQTAFVKKGSKFGMIDRNGREVLSVQYDQIIKAPGGRVLLMNGDKLGFASVSGQLLHKPEYIHMFSFNNEGICLALVSRQKKAKLFDTGNTYALVNIEGKELVRTDGASLMQLIGDKQKEPVCAMKVDTFDTSSGYFYNGKNNTFYNLDGEPVLNDVVRTRILQQILDKKSNAKKKHKELEFIESTPSYDIIAFAYNEQISDLQVRIATGYYDIKKQKILFPQTYTASRHWNSKTQQYYFRADNKLVDNKRFFNGHAITTITDAGTETGDYLLNTDGNVISRFKPNSCSNFVNGYMVAMNDENLYGLINAKLEVVIPYQFNAAKRYVNKNGIWSVRRGDKWGVIDVKNNLVVPFEYDMSTQSNEIDVIFVKQHGLWGAYENNHQILECLYDSLFALCDSSFVYRYKKQYGLYTLMNHSLSPTHDGYLGIYPADPVYHNNQMRMFFLMAANGKQTYGMLDGYGDKAVPFMFTDKKQVLQAYYYIRNEPTRSFTRSDRRRLRLKLTRRTRTYKMNTTIPNSEWDY